MATSRKQTVAEATCDACGETSGTLLTYKAGTDYALCAACIDEEIRTSGDPAPGCYCSGSVRCDFCNGLRVWGVVALDTPRAVEAAAVLYRTRPLALSRWTTERLCAAGFTVEQSRVDAEAAS